MEYGIHVIVMTLLQSCLKCDLPVRPLYYLISEMKSFQLGKMKEKLNSENQISAEKN